MQNNMLLSLLALLEHLSNYVYAYYAQGKSMLRAWLGPEPAQYFLLPDQQVLPTCMNLPEEVKIHACVYDPATQRISKPNSEGRFRPLPYLSMCVKHEGSEFDMSDWIGTVRANPIPSFLSIKQIVTLWSLTQNKYVPFGPAAQVHITKNTGDEEIHTL